MSAAPFTPFAPAKRGRRCPEGADEGAFFGKIRDLDGKSGDRLPIASDVVAAGANAPHPPLRGTFSPQACGEKGGRRATLASN
jgi:hypothetical protein